MSRISGGDVIRVSAVNNIYTALAAAGFIATLAATVLFFLKAGQVLGSPLFQ